MKMESKINLSPQELRYATYEIVYRAYEDYMYVINLSDHTRKAYLCNFRKYHSWCLEAGIEQVYDQLSVKQYLVYRVKQGARWQTKNNIYSAMRKLFREVLELSWSLNREYALENLFRAEMLAISVVSLDLLTSE